jgi:hypothetical protein
MARSQSCGAEPRGRGGRNQVARAGRAGGAHGVVRGGLHGACLAWSICQSVGSR